MNPQMVWASIFAMALSTYLIRVIPIIAFRKPIKNPYVRSFLDFVPYAVLPAMTFPAVFNMEIPLTASAAGVITALVMAWRSKSLLSCAFMAAFVTACFAFVFQG